jgi:hypothetical protein
MHPGAWTSLDLAIGWNAVQRRFHARGLDFWPCHGGARTPLEINNLEAAAKPLRTIETLLP